VAGVTSTLPTRPGAGVASAPCWAAPAAQDDNCRSTLLAREKRAEESKRRYALRRDLLARMRRAGP
jgi:hypothetical protein